MQLHIENRNKLHSLKAGLALVETIANLYPNQFQFIQNENGKYFFDLLAGTKRLRKYILDGEAESYLEESQQELELFKKNEEKNIFYTVRRNTASMREKEMS